MIALPIAPTDAANPSGQPPAQPVDALTDPDAPSVELDFATVFATPAVPPQEDAAAETETAPTAVSTSTDADESSDIDVDQTVETAQVSPPETNNDAAPNAHAAPIQNTAEKSTPGQPNTQPEPRADTAAPSTQPATAPLTPLHYAMAQPRTAHPTQTANPNPAASPTPADTAPEIKSDIMPQKQVANPHANAAETATKGQTPAQQRQPESIPAPAATKPGSANALPATPNNPTANQPAAPLIAEPQPKHAAQPILPPQPVAPKQSSNRTAPPTAQTQTAKPASATAPTFVESQTLIKEQLDTHSTVATPSRTSSEVSGTAPPPPQTAQANHTVHRQIIAHLQQANTHQTELQLAPEELGRIRLTLHTSEQGLTLTIQAERSETSDLLRRNLADLGQEFADLGYSDINFSFGDKDRDTAPDPTNTDANSSVDDEHPELASSQPLATQAQRSMAAGSGLDIRL